MWSWQTAQPAVSPSQTAAVVSVRSRAYRTRYYSSIAPPSLVVMLQRLKPEAILFSSDASGSKSFGAVTGAWAPPSLDIIRWRWMTTADWVHR